MQKKKNYSSPYELEGRIPLGQAILYGLQHVMAMFVGNLTPVLLVVWQLLWGRESLPTVLSFLPAFLVDCLKPY